MSYVNVLTPYTRTTLNAASYSYHDTYCKVERTNSYWYLSWQFDHPGGRNDDAGVHAERTVLLDLVHHEAADLVVVGDLAPRAADSDDLLRMRARKQTNRVGNDQHRIKSISKE